MEIKFINDTSARREIAREILADLPEWFGIPESTEEYIRESGDMPFFAATDAEEHIGFMSMKETSPFTCEIYVCGVKSAVTAVGRDARCLLPLQHMPAQRAMNMCRSRRWPQGITRNTTQRGVSMKALASVPLKCSRRSGMKPIPAW